MSVESIYQLLSPFKDPFGLAAYVEWTHGPKTSELELKAIVQKNLMDDQLVLAANLAVELEDENWSGLGSETPGATCCATTRRRSVWECWVRC